MLILFTFLLWGIPPESPTKGISLGQFPYQIFSDTLAAYETRDILTVPSGQVFVITAGTMDNELIEVYANNSLRVAGGTGIFYTRAIGPVHVPIHAGETLRLVNTYGSTSNFYIEGHYSEATDFPYQSYTGSLSSGQSQNLLTVPSNKEFVIVRLSINAIQVDVYEDNQLRVKGASRVFIEPHSSFNKGTAHLRFPSGSTIKLINNGAYTRDYYMEGYLR